MEPPEPKLDLSIREILRPHLAEDGFTGSGKHSRRQVTGWIHAINIQVSKYGGEFCINFGIHPASVPTDFQPDPKKIREINCEFRSRLARRGLALSRENRLHQLILVRPAALNVAYPCLIRGLFG